MSLRLHTLRGDLSREFSQEILHFGKVAIDSETTALSWKKGKIATCQFYVPGRVLCIVQINDIVPKRICRIVSDKNIDKVFHHAMFDLRFMLHHWKVVPNNILCTKIAAKLLDPTNQYKTTLVALLRRYLKEYISKYQRLSNWKSDILTESQKTYAVKDVLFLFKLMDRLETELRQKGIYKIAKHCFDFIPVRVMLDVGGYEDIFVY